MLVSWLFLLQLRKIEGLHKNLFFNTIFFKNDFVYTIKFQDNFGWDFGQFKV